jgi:spore maturation protein CgeD
MLRPIVSIILTSYNKPNTVGKAIKSVLEQTLKEWELFIMDDASKDETIKMIEPFLKDERIHFFNSQVEDCNRYKTTRYATLINSAIPKTKGKYLSYLTDDTIYLPNRLKTMVHELERNPAIDVVYSSQKVLHVNNQSKIMSEKNRMSKGTLRSAANIVDHCSVVHTRRIAEKVYQAFGGYWDDDPKYWHNGDAAFWTRLNEFTLFYPINEILDISYKTPYSFQNLNVYLPENIPEGTLVKGYLPDIYLIENNTRRHITRGLLKRLNYQTTNIIEIPDPILFKHPLGPQIDESIFHIPCFFPNGRLVKANNTSKVYYIQEHKKRLILNHNTFKKFKFNKLDIIELSMAFLEQFEEGPCINSCLTNETLLPDQVIFNESDCYFLSHNNHLHPIDRNILNKLKIPKQQSVQMTKEERRLFSEGKSFNWTYFQRKKNRKRKNIRSFGKSIFLNKKA